MTIEGNAIQMPFAHFTFSSTFLTQRT